METPHGLLVTSLSDPNYLRVLERGIRLGLPVLIEQVPDTLEPTLAPVLMTQTYTLVGKLLLGADSDWSVFRCFC